MKISLIIKLRFLLVLFLVHPVFFVNNAIGQDVLLIRKPQGVSYVFKFNIENCRFDSLGWINPYHPVFSDYAMSPSQMIFTPNGNLYSNVMGCSYWLMLADFDWTMNFPDTIRTNYVSDDYNNNGLAYDCIISNEKGHIYDMSYDLKKYYPDADKWEFIGTQPDFFGKSIYLGYHHPVFQSLTRRGKDYYYVASLYIKTDPVDSMKFIKLDILDPSKSKELFSFRKNIWIWSVFSIQTRCHEFKTYIIYSKYINSDINNGHNLEKYALAELDINTGEITDICDFGKSLRGNYAMGVGVPWTQLDSDCLLILDLDEDDSSGALSDIDFADTVRCSLDSIHITDIDPDVFAYNPINRLEVFFKEPPADGAKEYFIASPVSGVSITGSGTQHISLVGGTAPDYPELKSAIKKLIYRNSSSNPSAGERKIAFVGYTNTIISDTAISHIFISDVRKSAGKDSVLIMCQSDPAVNLNNYLSHEALLSGRWTGDLHHEGFFDPSIDKAGIYGYIIDDSVCGNDTANIELIINPRPEIDLGEDMMLCEGRTATLHAEHIEAEKYKWQDGSTEKTYQVEESGLYYLEITDDKGCKNADSIYVEFYPGNEVVRKDTTICKGQTINWNGQEIDTMGDYTYVTPDINGCDSIQKLHVEIFAVPQSGISGTTIICIGGSTTLTGGEFVKFKWSTGSEEKVIDVNKPGWYKLTLTDSHGCTWSDSVFIDESPPIIVEYITEPERCFGTNDGIIKIEKILGGTGEKKAYVNGEAIETGSSKTNLKPDTYILKITDSLNCREEILINISGADQLWCDLGKDIEVLPETELEIELKHNVKNVTKIEWFAEGKVILANENILKLEPIDDTEIIAVITDQKGCEVRDTIEIRLKEDIDIYLPNVFSPNGDGINDIFTIRGSKKIEYVESIDIFDRWGENIHHAEHIPFNSLKTSLWDGKYKGKGLLPGVYVFVIQLLLKSGEMVIKYGDITIIK